MSLARDVSRSVVRSLRPGPAPLAVARGARAFGAAALIAGYGALLGDMRGVAIAYLGAACTAAFVTGGAYRNRARALVAQALGALLGITVGTSVPHEAVWTVTAATLLGAVSGAVGALGPGGPGFGMMLSVGVAYGQFAGSSLPWWQQVLAYSAGTTLMIVVTLAPWAVRRGAVEREAAAAVMAAAADLCAAAGTRAGREARTALAAASAAAREAGPEPRAELVAVAAAALYAEGERVPADAVAAVRTAGEQILADRPVSVRFLASGGSPGLRALAEALTTQPSKPVGSVVHHTFTLRTLRTPQMALNAGRVALCMGAATTLTLALHEPSHSFWLPLTVAVIVRPEYASVFVRTVNRVCGTLVGAAVTAALLAPRPTALAVAFTAAAALGFAALTAPKLYALNVVGVTASALLSSSLTGPDPVLPAVRMLDTLLGAVLAVVLGYLVWPGARRSPGAALWDAAAESAVKYLDEAVRPPADREHFRTRRDEAYLRAHQARATVEAAALELPPVSDRAVALIPAACRLEDTVDAITALAAERDAGAVDLRRATELRKRLTLPERAEG
ncbi:FUSC family protein [Streptomyces sp. NPDC090303]|uniref:FUSC family protein n=1 Tax=Streptomyces sp. NPDC090303 TaxID=3365960 RepID=UPI00382BCE79